MIAGTADAREIAPSVGEDVRVEQDMDPDIGTHDVAVRRAGVDVVGQSTVARPAYQEWVLTFATDGQTWHGNGGDLFNALRDLRRGLDSDGILIGLNGARPECAVSGMLADMGEGRDVYVLKGGARAPAGRPWTRIALAFGLLLDRNRRLGTVRTLGPAPLDEVSNVASQDAHKRRWLG